MVIVGEQYLGQHGLIRVNNGKEWIIAPLAVRKGYQDASYPSSHDATKRMRSISASCTPSSTTSGKLRLTHVVEGMPRRSVRRVLHA